MLSINQMKADLPIEISLASITLHIKEPLAPRGTMRWGILDKHGVQRLADEIQRAGVARLRKIHYDPDSATWIFTLDQPFHAGIHEIAARVQAAFRQALDTPDLSVPPI